MITASWELTDFRSEGSPSLTRSLGESLIYIVGGILMLVVPAIFLVGSLVVDYHPVWLLTLALHQNL